MTDIAANPGQTGDILSKHVTETTQNIIKKLRGGGSRKRKRASSCKPSSQREHKAKKAKRKRKASSKTIKTDIFVIRIIHYPIMSVEVEFVSNEFGIFAHKPIQLAILGTDVVHHKPIATVDQNDLEFLIPGDSETYTDQDIKLFVRGRLIGVDSKDLDASDFTAGTNNFLHSLFSQCNISLINVNITPASELYPYRSYSESLLTYGSDAANSHLTNAFWYLDEGDVLAGDPTSISIKNKGFLKRWERQKQSKVIELYGRLHADICNFSQFLLSGVRIQIRLTKAKDDFYLMNAHDDTKTKATFKFLDAELIVRRIRPSPKILVAHSEALSKGCLGRYNVTRVELKTFTFAGGPQAISINNAVLGMLPKRLIFTMVMSRSCLVTAQISHNNLNALDWGYFRFE